MTHALRIAFAVALAGALAACSSHDDSATSEVGCPAGATCSSATPRGPVHGARADGSVDITANEAWPDRPTEPPVLSEAEIAKACAALSRCYRDPQGKTVDDPARDPAGVFRGGTAPENVDDHGRESEVTIPRMRAVVFGRARSHVACREADARNPEAEGVSAGTLDASWMVHEASARASRPHERGIAGFCVTISAHRGDRA